MTTTTERPAAVQFHPAVQVRPVIPALAGPYAERDRDVLLLKARGLTQLRIAGALGISATAVNSAALRVKQAYGAATSAGAVARALAAGDIACPRWRPPQPTGRQREVLALVAADLTDLEIAGRIGATRPCVRMHVRMLLALFGASCRTRLVVEAFGSGVLVVSADGWGLVLGPGVVR